VNDRAADLIATLGLRPHPEGGHYGEVFRSVARVRPVDRDVERVALTTIYFLLEAGEWSRWHRVRADEAWHFYEGDPLDLLWLEPPSGDVVRRPLGAYTLVGCTVAPGFEFADFVLLADAPAEAARLRVRYPELAELF
jgi:hypothetical protein